MGYNDTKEAKEVSAMRRLTAILLLLMLLFAIPASADTPDDPPFSPIGRWETRLEETLCATILHVLPNGVFQYVSEGVTTRGTWAQEDYVLYLDGDDGGTWEYTFDPTLNALALGDGLHLWRPVYTSGNEVEYQSFVCMSDAYTGHFAILLENTSWFYLVYYIYGGVHPDMPQGAFHHEAGYDAPCETWKLWGVWASDGQSIILASLDGAYSWELELDPETGIPLDVDGYHFLP